MSVSRPARCLLSAPPVPSLRPRIRCQNLHSSPSHRERRRPKFPSVKASDMGLISTPKTPGELGKLFKPYTFEEKKALAKKYTPEQLEAIEAGEKAINPSHLGRRGVIRSDMGTLPYIEDFSRTRPLLDNQQKYKGPIDPNIRFMTPGESHAAMANTWQEYGNEKKAWESLQSKKPKKESISGMGEELGLNKSGIYVPEERLDEMKTSDREPWFVGTDGKFIPRNQTPMAFAPGLPRRFSDEEDAAIEKDEEDVDPRDPDGIYNRLIKSSGLTLDEILNYNVKILVRHRVVNQTRLGKIASVYCLAIAGNGNGRLGIGEAKGQEAEETQANARIAAIRAMQPIPRYEERTIFGEVDAKVSAVELKLMSRPPGFGLRCQHLIFEMARAAGIHDLAAKVPRSRNKMNTVKAAYKAMLTQRIPDEIARGRGKKLVDVRKVYYGGRV
ncbi:uncharacterized protein LY89DRAFT_605656 [Mollisia scopiformis]|uniref:Small ribosomal subunit protein uS5m n=1 Tax=Mollisia scopiformis TaxID=149040 RepID=A0A194XS42_MOLSC|nr:uncharacterized protein LY89DRAFT_605656 [Mollisia scopiformis]KUJ23013.1 hypothetical protein LY89DRAFT_605656 [Mollisia scopiformis]